MTSKQIPKKIVYLVLTSLASIFLFAHSAHAAPATFVVNVTTDEADANPGDGICETVNTGECTFRAAIEEANANVGADTVNFNIPGSGVHTISPTASNWPKVDDQVDINGFSQPGSSANTAAAPAPLNSNLTIELDGSGMDRSEKGLLFNSGAGASMVRGIAIHGFGHSQIEVNGASDVRIEGLYINTDITGMQSRYNSNGEETEAIAAYSSGSDLYIGGATAAQRNVIASKTSYGPGSQIGGTNTFVYGNYFGIAKDGVTDLDTTFSLDNTGSNNTVGGPLQGQMNVLSGSTTAQITITGGSDTKVQGNYIGTDYTGEKNSGITNGGGIVVTYMAHDVLIGGVGSGEGNTVRAVGGLGISVLGMNIQAFQMVLKPTNISILGNKVSDMLVFNYPNFGNSNLAIDLSTSVYVGAPNQNGPDSFTGQGPTPNDTGDADTGPNNLMNKPVLKSVQQIGNQLTIHYDLDAADSPSNTYRVEFFVNDESTVFGAGPAQEYLGAVASTGNGTDKTATFTVSGDYTNKALSATTTAIDDSTLSGYGSTSELSQNISVGSASDFDSDGIADSVENGAPNNGDGNNDGTADRLQPTVTSFEIDSTGKWETFVTEGRSENGTVASIDASTITNKDAGKAYPYGLTDFSLNCSRGDTVNITKYVFVSDVPSAFTLRKYNDITGQYRDVPGSNIASQTVGSAQALVATYSITDGGELDDDGADNGVIVDPVGLATTSLANTGTNLSAYMLGVITLIAGGVWLSRKALQT